MKVQVRKAIDLTPPPFRKFSWVAAPLSRDKHLLTTAQTKSLHLPETLTSMSLTWARVHIQSRMLCPFAKMWRMWQSWVHLNTTYGVALVSTPLHLARRELICWRPLLWELVDSNCGTQISANLYRQLILIVTLLLGKFAGHRLKRTSCWYWPRWESWRSSTLRGKKTTNLTRYLKYLQNYLQVFRLPNGILVNRERSCVLKLQFLC